MDFRFRSLKSMLLICIMLISYTNLSSKSILLNSSAFNKSPSPSTASAQAEASEPITYAVIGDFGNGSSNETAVANLVKGWNPQFVITTGDDRYGSTTFDLTIGRDYCNFLAGALSGSNCTGNLAAVNSFFPCAGNHEYTDGLGGGINEYLDYFDLPGVGISTFGKSNSELYYDFIQGPIHFFVIDSYTADNDGGVQKNWLQAQMAASTSIWNIVYFHHPPYTSGDHGPTNYMAWPFAQWGADAVLNGHDHTYERIMQDGIVYFVNGLGGMSKYGFLSTIEPGSVIRYNAEYGAQKVVADNVSMTFSFININNEIIDEYTIYKTSPPVVSLSSPLNNTYFDTPQTITVSADASDPDGTVAQVEFFIDGNWIGVVNVQPYSLDWSIPSNGAYSIKAKATDNLGATTISSPIDITVGVFSKIVSAQISSGNDDVEESSAGVMYLTSTDIELVYDSYNSAGNQIVGLRFPEIGIPQGAYITNAYLQFTVDEIVNTDANLSISGHSIDNSPAFSSAAFDVSGRSKTTASVNWIPPTWNTSNEAGTDQQTPDLSPIIQEIVNRPTFSQSSAVSIIITGTGTRTAWSYEGMTGSAAVLHVEYSNIQNDPPAFVSNPITKLSATEDAAYSSSLAGDATDPDNDILSYSKISGPVWLAVGTNGDLSGTPLNEHVGPNSWIVQASDGKGGIAQTSLQITVINTNDAPEFTANPLIKTNAFLGLPYTASISTDATDVDNDVLTFRMVSTPTWLSLAPNGALTGTPTTVGIENWTIEVSDENGGTNRTELQITVIDPANITYCSSSGDASSEWIKSIQVDGITNTSNSNGGYYDFSNKLASFNLESNVLANIALTPDFSGRSTFQYWAVWIDYDKNGNFENDELVFASGKNKSTVSGSFQTGSDLGITRMRISMSNSGTPPSCGLIGGGEVEDYLVNITQQGINFPAANFTADKTNILIGETIKFNDLSLNNPTGWSWDFGNQETSTSQNPSATYNTEGTYTVVLTASNDAGSNTKTVVDYITVSPLSTSAPVADFTASSILISVGEQVQFTDLSSNLPTSWSWNFGDGQTSSLQNPSIIYNSPGTYTITLAATNGNGTNILSQTDYITVSAITVGIYCQPTNIDNSSDYITNINIGGTNKSSVRDGNGFVLFDNPIFNLTKGVTYNVNLESFDPKNRNFWRIWLDANGDGDYDDPNETLFAANNKRGSVSGNITIPPDATTKNTRLRISMKTGSSPSACDDNFSGEVEDYYATIITPTKSGVIATSTEIVADRPEILFQAFPNPATDKLFVRFNGWAGEKEIKLIDLTGRSVLILKSVEEINEINISSFPKGIYIINVKNEFHRVVQKIKIQ